MIPAIYHLDISTSPWAHIFSGRQNKHPKLCRVDSGANIPGEFNRQLFTMSSIYLNGRFTSALNSNFIMRNLAIN